MSICSLANPDYSKPKDCAIRTYVWCSAPNDGYAQVSDHVNSILALHRKISYRAHVWYVTASFLKILINKWEYTVLLSLIYIQYS